MSGASQIEHVVVLMLENRSFDHMLGYLKLENQEIDGLTGGESNPSIGSQEIKVFHAPQDSPILYAKTPDPNHEFPAVNLQLFEAETPPPHYQPTNRGFIWSYALQPLGKDQPGMGYLQAHNIMCCFHPAQVPILSTLAKNFTLCDHWFASVPGSTWPNRFFVHAATSGGDLLTPSGLTSMAEVEAKFKTYQLPTIFDNLEKNGIKWRIYHHGFPQVMALANLRRLVKYGENVKEFKDTFESDVTEGNLPTYTFIEPSHFPILTMPNDQHPPYDVRAGERLIAQVYNALRKSKLWQTSLLVILYDEHGGFFDHVPPPRAVRPDGKASTDPFFKFDRLGVRVPAILISPYLSAGVDHTDYDHTSLLATVKKLFNLPDFLTERDKAASTFEHNFGKSREDALPPFKMDELPSFPTDFSYDLSPYVSLLMKLAIYVAEKEDHQINAEFLEGAKKLLGLGW